MSATPRFVACIEDRNAHQADTRETAVSEAVDQWREDMAQNLAPGEGPDSITVNLFWGVTICDSVDEDGDCPCGEGDAHEEGRWVVHSWEGSASVEIPMTYDEEGDPIDLTHEALERALAVVKP
jgi:ribonuclease I